MFNSSLSLAKSVFKSSIFNTIWRSTYKSSISLDRLYPTSNLDLTAKLSSKKFESNENPETFSGIIPIGKVFIFYPYNI